MTIETLSKSFNKFSEIKLCLFTLCIGALSALSFAPLFVIPTYLVALPYLVIVIMNASSWRQAFKYGYIFGIGHFFVGLYWIGNSFAVEPEIPDWAGYIMVLALCCYLAIFIGLVGAVVKYIHKRHSLNSHLISVCLTFVIVWVIGEWLRGHLFTGFPWNLSGYIWGFSDIMLQSTAIWGIYGLSLITLLLCFAPFIALDKKYKISAPIISIMVIGFCFFYGYNRIPESIDNVEGINLRIVQPNIKQQDKWPLKNWGPNLMTFMGMSEGVKEGLTTHIIWPETAVIYSLSEEAVRRQLISKVVSDGGTLLTGFPRRDRSGEQAKLYNSFIAIDYDGQIKGIYDKSHLVPFGEYIPGFIRSILVPLGFAEIFTGGQDFSEGDGLKTLHIEGLPPVGVLICYEVIFPGRVRDQSDKPEWLLNITNDAWYGESTGPYQHFLQSRVRAIEEGVPLVRSASTGISAIFDPYGRPTEIIALNKKGVINGELPKALENETIYSTMKEWIFCFIVVMIIVINFTFIYRTRHQVDKA